MFEKTKPNFHFYWIGPNAPPDVMYQCLESFFKVYQNDAHAVIHLNDLWINAVQDNFLLLKFPLEFFSYEIIDETNRVFPLELYFHPKYPNHNVDFFKLDDGWKHGGIFCDIDILFLRKLPDYFLHPDKAYCTDYSYSFPETPLKVFGLANAFWSCEKGNPFIKAWRDGFIRCHMVFNYCMIPCGWSNFPKNDETLKNNWEYVPRDIIFPCRENEIGPFNDPKNFERIVNSPEIYTYHSQFDGLDFCWKNLYKWIVGKEILDSENCLELDISKSQTQLSSTSSKKIKNWIKNQGESK